MSRLPSGIGLTAGVWARTVPLASEPARAGAQDEGKKLVHIAE
jgi:hypothetical protein